MSIMPQWTDQPMDAKLVQDVWKFGIRVQMQSAICNDLINIETVPDLAVEGIDHLDMHEQFFRVFKASMISGIPEIIAKYSDSEFPVKAIMYDSVVPWILDVAHENGLKGAVLFTQSCSVCSVFYHVHKGLYEIPPKEGGEVSLPAMPVLEVKDLPSLVYDVGPYQAILKALVEQFSTFVGADWRLWNTFDKLEDEMLKWMSNQYPILTVGPTIPSMYTDKRLEGNYDYGLSFFKTNDESSCMKWLDEKRDKSVIYVSFGSLANLGEKQIEELARGLIDTQYSFLWVARDDESKVPRDFPPEKGLIVNWCHQLEVLSHKAIGCFFTHCGWNSTLEALVFGVPMVTMPQWTDQPTNAKLIVDLWKVGIRVKRNEEGIVMREEVTKRVSDVMRGEIGIEIKRNVVKLKDLAIEAVSEGGSSDRNITKFVEELLAL